MRVYYEKLGHMLKPPVPKFRSDLSVRSRDIAGKQVPAKLKPIVDYVHTWFPEMKKAAYTRMVAL